MSEPLAALALARHLLQKEMTVAILRAKVIELESADLDGVPKAHYIQRRITELQDDCGQLAHKLVTEMEKR